MLTIKTCPKCDRDFIPSTCEEHCGVECCRKAVCVNMRPFSKDPTRKSRNCIVCGRSNLRFPFERFAACDENCDRTFYGTTRQDPMRSDVARKWLCPGAVHDLAPPWDMWHRPAAKPRIHRLYCSLRCYTHTTRGHDARVRGARKEAQFRYWRKRGGRSAILTELRRRKTAGLT